MKMPLIKLPMFVTTFIELVVSMKRVQKFIGSDEVQKNIVKRVASDDDRPALRVQGHFSWGLNDEAKPKDIPADKKEKKGKKDALIAVEEKPEGA